MSKLLGVAKGYTFSINKYNGREFITATPSHSHTATWLGQKVTRIPARKFKRLKLQEAIFDSIPYSAPVSLTGEV